MSQNNKVCDGCDKPSQFRCCESCYEIRLGTSSHCTMICNCSGCKITRKIVAARRNR